MRCILLISVKNIPKESRCRLLWRVQQRYGRCCGEYHPRTQHGLGSQLHVIQCEQGPWWHGPVWWESLLLPKEVHVNQLGGYLTKNSHQMIVGCKKRGKRYMWCFFILWKKSKVEQDVMTKDLKQEENGKRGRHRGERSKVQTII